MHDAGTIDAELRGHVVEEMIDLVLISHGGLSLIAMGVIPPLETGNRNPHRGDDPTSPESDIMRFDMPGLRTLHGPNDHGCRSTILPRSTLEQKRSHYSAWTAPLLKDSAAYQNLQSSGKPPLAKGLFCLFTSRRRVRKHERRL